MLTNIILNSDHPNPLRKQKTQKMHVWDLVVFTDIILGPSLGHPCQPPLPPHEGCYNEFGLNLLEFT